MKRLQYLIALLLCVAFFCCGKEDTKEDPTPSKSSEKKLLTFKFEKAKNTTLTSDVKGEIDASKFTVKLSIAQGINVSSLKATFTVSSKAVLKIGDKEQKSGETANNFSIPPTYTVVAEDGSKQDYSVSLERTTAGTGGNSGGNTGGNTVSNKNLKTGYRNSGFALYYHPIDGKIYYISDAQLYKMDLDGSNSKKIGAKVDPKTRYLYVYGDYLYYAVNESKDAPLRRMKLDGSGAPVILDEKGKGKMKVYGDRLYYIKGEIKVGAFRNTVESSIWSIGLDGTDRKVVVPYNDQSENAATVLHRTSAGFHVKGGDIYYHSGADPIAKTNLSTGTITKLSSGLLDNYVFYPDNIYYRTHLDSYSIGKNSYTLKTGTHKKLRDTQAGQIEDKNGLNGSDTWFVYYARASFPTTSTSNSHGLYAVSRDGSTEKKLEDLLNQFSPKPSIYLDAGFSIIGDWVYYLYRTAANTYDLRRIHKSDGAASKVILKGLILK